jgi:hypothetical protein
VLHLLQRSASGRRVNFTPFPAAELPRARGCVSCTHFSGEFYGGSIALALNTPER